VENIMIKTHLKQATRALVLLLDNAQKFTTQKENSPNQEETKKPSVLLKVARTDGFVQFIVEDTGVGVPAKEAEHIFGEFVQLDEYYEGTGIGLTIARSIARRLGGDIVLDTSYTGGARFVYTVCV
jgi:signal transduction histidine kinase